MLALLWETTSIVQRVQCASGREFERQTNGMVMVGYGIHGVRGTLVLVVLGHSPSRCACVDDMHMRKARNKTQKRGEGREKEDTGPLSRSGLRHLLSPRRCSHTRSKSDFRLGQDNTMPRAPTFVRTHRDECPGRIRERFRENSRS